MSHFVMGVVVPGDEPLTFVDDALAPFDENIEVKPYQRKCWCIGKEAEAAIAKEVAEMYGSWDDLRNKFHAQEKIKQVKAIQDKLNLKKPDEAKRYSEIEDSTQKLWEKFIKPRQDYEKKCLRDHPGKNAPMKSCEACKGTGKETVTYNPKSKWDWYEVGGRWDGFFGKTNVTTVKEHLKQLKKAFDAKVCFGYLVDGEWIEKGDMGYWGMVANEKSEQIIRKKFLSLLEKLDPDDRIVAVDVHI